MKTRTARLDHPARLEQLRARLAAAERERDRLAVEVDEVNARHGRVREAALETQRQLTAERANWMAEVARLRTEIETLREEPCT